MYYDDEARRFNFVSGLLFGAVLGVGLALLGSPQDRVRSRGGRRRGKKTWKKKATRRLHRLRDEMADSLSDVVSTGRRYLQR